MGFIDRLRDVLAPIPEAKDSTDGGAKKQDQIVQGLGGWGRTSGTAQMTDVAAALVGYAYRCIELRAGSFAKATPSYYTKSGQDERSELPLDHWLVKLMNNPNPVFTKNEVRRAEQQSLDYFGSAYIYCPRFGGKVPMQYHVLDPRRVQVLQDPDTYVRKYYYLKSIGGYIEIDPTEMLHKRNTNIGSAAYMLKGYPTIAAVYDAMAINAELKQFVNRYFRTDAIPPLLFASENDINTTVQDQIRSHFNAVLPNVKVAGFMPNGLSIQPVASMSKEIADKLIGDAVGAEVIKEICSTFGIPVSMLDGEKDAYAGAVQVTNNYLANAIEPICALHSDAESNYFSQFESGLECVYEVEYMTDRDYELQELTSLGYVPNEIRKRQGLDPVDGGDVFLIPGNFITLKQVVSGAAPTETAAEPAAPAPTASAPEPAPPPAEPITRQPEKKKTVVEATAENAGKPEGKTEGNSEAISEVISEVKSTEPDTLEIDPWADSDYALAQYTKAAKRLDKGTAAIKADVVKSFDKLERVVLDNLERRRKKRYTAAGKLRKRYIHKDDDSVLTESTEPLFDVDEFIEEFLSNSDNTVKEVVREAMKHALDEVGENWDEIESEFDVAINETVKEVASKISEPVKTANEELSNILRRMSNEPFEEIKAEIMDKFKTYKESRAEAIARTTSTAANGTAQSNAWDKMKIPYVWLTQRDGEVRATHRLADGQSSDDNGLFHVGDDTMKSPCMGKLAKENVNCRCVLRAKPKRAKHIEYQNRKYLDWCTARVYAEITKL